MRWWRTGQRKPFVDFKAIEGPALQQLHPVRVNFIGAQRLLKRLSGQHFTLRPGNLSLATGEILAPTGMQTFRYYGNMVAANVLLNPVAWAGAYGIYYVGANWNLGDAND